MPRATLVLALAALGGAARAAPIVHVRGEGTCPGAAALGAELGRLLPGRVVTAGPAPAGAAGVLVRDLGARYLVSAAGVDREADDPRRDCAERARAGAVLAALALEPPSIGDTPAPPSPPVPAERSAPRSGSMRRGPRVELEAGAAAALSPRPGRDQDVLVSGGGGLRLFVGGAHLGGSLGAQGLSPVEPTLPGARARLLRLPFDLSLRALLRRGPVELVGEAGLLAAALRVEGLELPGALAEPRAEWRLELGLRLGLGLRLWVHPRLAPFASVEGQVLPRPYDLVLLPGEAPGEASGEAIAQTPWLWLSGAIGLAVRLR